MSAEDTAVAAALEEAQRIGLQQSAAPSTEQAFTALEEAYDLSLGGVDTRPVRQILGVTMGTLVMSYNADPRSLADYVREGLRLMYPESFDTGV